MLPLRPLLAAAVVVLILGSVYAYTQFLGHLKARALEEAHVREHELAVAAAGKFEVEVMPTFAAQVDEFEAVGTAASLKVQIGGSRGPVLLERTDVVPAFVPIRFEASDVHIGDNVFWIEATPKTDDLVPPAVRVRVLRNGDEIAQATYWGQAGSKVAGELKVKVDPLPGAAH